MKAFHLQLSITWIIMMFTEKRTTASKRNYLNFCPVSIEVFKLSSLRSFHTFGRFVINVCYCWFTYNCSKFFQLADVTSGLRGHSLKVFKPRCHTTVRRNFFSLRIVNEWNKLPQDVVDASLVNMFKNRLDRHWQDMGITSWPATPPINLKYKYEYK